MEPRIDRVLTPSTTHLKGPASDTAGVKEGIYQGKRVVHHLDMQSMIADAAEELTFQESETVEKKISKRKVSKGRGKGIPEAVKRAEFYLKQLPDLKSSRRLEEFLEHVRQMKDRSPRSLRRESRRLFKDPSHAYAALAYARDMVAMEGGDRKLVDALETALKEEMAEDGPAIRAGLNVTRTAQSYSDSGLGSTGELRQFYRETVFDYSGLGDLFGKLKEASGGRSFKEMAAYMMEALEADLSSRGPSIDPIMLKQIIDDLYGVQVIKNTEMDFERLSAQMERIFHHRPLLAPEDMARKLFALKEERLASPRIFFAILDKNGLTRTDEKIFFLREFREVARRLPEKAYAEGEDRGHFLDVMQQALDEIMEEEEA